MAEYDFSMFEKPKEKKLDFSMFEEGDKSTQKVAELGPTIGQDDKLDAPNKGELNGFLGGPINEVTKEKKESIALQKLIEETPELPLTVLGMNPEKAQVLFSQYEAKGVDPGYEVITVMKPGGTEQKVRPKTYIRGQKPLSLEAQKRIREQLDEERKRVAQSRTSAFEQVMEGLTRPTNELVMGAMSIITQDPSYMELVKDPNHAEIPFEDLDPVQKSAYAIGTAVGYAGPGTMMNTAAKGMVKVGLKKAGKEAAAKAAQKTTLKYVGKTVGKLPGPDVAKQIIGSYAGKFIKNAPTLAIEGAAWEALASGGDLERTIEGAYMFPLMGPAAEVGMKGISQGLKKGIGKMSDTVIKKLPVRAPDDVFTRPEGLTDEAYRKMKLVEGFHLSSMQEAEREWAQAQLKVKNNRIQKVVKSIQTKKQVLVERRDKLAEQLKNKKAIEVIYGAPKSFDDIKGSYNLKAELQDKFGSLKNLTDAGGKEPDGLVGVLTRSV